MMADDTRQGETGGTNDADLAPADEAILDAVWDMLDKRWKAEDEAAQQVKKEQQSHG